MVYHQLVLTTVDRDLPSNNTINSILVAATSHWTGTAIDGGYRTRNEVWTLGMTGNWTDRKIDVNGDGDFADSVDIVDDTNVFTKANDWTSRKRTTGGAASTSTITYDDVGNMTRVGLNPRMVYDVFGRLVRTEQNINTVWTPVIKYQYNGLGHRTVRQCRAEDVNPTPTSCLPS